MATTTVQLLLFLFICLCTALIIWGAIRNKSLEQEIEEQRRSKRQVQREIEQIEMHRPNHIIKGDNQ
jgi:membrane protein implicated in regulation of membrane protease activity